MSTWTGGNVGSDDSYSDTQCRWQMCTTYVPYRFLNENMFLCREHALWVWSIVNDQLANGDTSAVPEEEPAYIRDQPLRPPMPGYVYYIRTGGRIKIGHTVNLGRRLSQYPPDIEVLFVQVGAKDLERSEHLRFRAYLAEGREWFQDRPEVSDVIEEMASTIPWQGLLGGNFWRRRQAPAVSVRRTS